MAITRFYNIVGGTLSTVELVEPSVSVPIKSITLANIHASADATIDLFIQDDPASGTTSTFYLIKAIKIPAGTSLILDKSSMFNFPIKFGLYIMCGASDTVDVLLNN